jgi:hypothetical protein
MPVPQLFEKAKVRPFLAAQDAVFLGEYCQGLAKIYDKCREMANQHPDVGLFNQLRR